MKCVKSERKKVLSSKKLCFNCTGTSHRDAECRCPTLCQICRKKRHTSICEGKPEQMLVANGDSSVIYHVVVVEVNGICCRALLDTGAGSSYASAALLDRIKTRPVRKEVRRVKMMTQTTRQVIEVHDQVNVMSISRKFNLKTEVIKVNRGVLLNLDNSKYPDLIKQYDHPDGINMNDTDTKQELPVHLILGTGEYTKIRTKTTPKIGKSVEPVAQLGWTIMSPGTEADLTKMLLTQTTPSDYENLCKLDILGLKDSPTGDQNIVYQEFKERLVRSPDGWYETGLLTCKQQRRKH